MDPQEGGGLNADSQGRGLDATPGLSTEPSMNVRDDAFRELRRQRRKIERREIPAPFSEGALPASTEQYEADLVSWIERVEAVIAGASDRLGITDLLRGTKDRIDRITSEVDTSDYEERLAAAENQANQ